MSERKYTVYQIAPLFKAIESNFQEFNFEWIEVSLQCVTDAKAIFPDVEQTNLRPDGVGYDRSSHQAVVFIEVTGPPEGIVKKHITDDTEKLIKEGIFGLIAELRQFLDKDAAEAIGLRVFMIQVIGKFFVTILSAAVFTEAKPTSLIDIGDQMTLSALSLNSKHKYDLVQLATAQVPFSFEHRIKYLGIFELQADDKNFAHSSLISDHLILINQLKNK